MKTFYEIEEYLFPVETKEQAMKIAERISNMRKKPIRILKNSNGIIQEIKI